VENSVGDTWVGWKICEAHERRETSLLYGTRSLEDYSRRISIRSRFKMKIRCG
jgi:hypothetical protein